MKKFAKMLALGLALAMTFGMVVSAAENPSVITKAPEVKAEGVNKDTNVTEETKAEVVEAVTAVQEDPQSVMPERFKVDEVIGTFYWTAPADFDPQKGAEVTLTGLKALPYGQNYVLLHVKDGVVDKYYDLGTAADGTAKATITEFSPFTLIVVSREAAPAQPGNATTTPAAPAAPVAPVSPKTGEALPVAGMMAVLCLAGALVCAKKARCNN